jgi:hypothetical protein
MHLADLWSLLHEGGLAVETRAAGKPALRTLLQLDGDRVTFVALRTLEPLSAEDRRLLAEGHAEAVRARLAGILADGRRVLPLLRHAALAGFGGGEVYSIATRVSLTSTVWKVDWLGLVHDQIVWLIVLIGRAALPWVVRRIVPWVIRWRYSTTARRLGDALHSRTRAMFPGGP